jgi:hypothetical protein
MTRLYRKNFLAAMKLASEIEKRNIIRFKTQSALFVLAEDCKNPHLKKHRDWCIKEKFINRTQQYYMPVNYTPMINWLISKGVLTKHRTGNSVNSKVEYHVNRTALKHVLTNPVSFSY